MILTIRGDYFFSYDVLTPHIVKRKSLISKDFFLPWQWEFQQMSRSYRHFRIKCI